MTTVIRSTAELHPAFQSAAEGLYKHLIRLHETGSLKFRFEIFETFRLPSRQKDLLAKGVSKAGPFDSAHQFGCAIDFVPFLSQAEAAALGVRPGWYWPEITDEAWQILKQTAALYGLERPFSWDGPHIQLPGWRKKVNLK